MTPRSSESLAESNPLSPLLVRMVRSTKESGGRDRFACSQAAWILLLQVAESFGWKPLGTTYVPTRDSSTTASDVRHDYQPGDERDGKQVEADDARAWAVALGEARRSPHLAAMLGATSDVSQPTAGAMSAESVDDSAPFDIVMDEFIEYARGGAFSFGKSVSTSS